MIENKDATIRDRFATAALVSLAYAGRLKASVGASAVSNVELYRPFAREAWLLADAMILERDASSEPPDPLSDNAITV